MAGFTDPQWQQALTLIDQQGAAFGLPERREGSVVLGTFNMLKLGNAADNRKRWDFLNIVASRFDLLAIQEVMDTLDGVRRIRDSLGTEYALLVSDTTGATPGDRGLRERLAFLYRWTRVSRDDLASDITYDRSHLVESLYDNRAIWTQWFNDFDQRVADANNAGTEPPSLSDFAHPAFSTFIRTPHCAAFNIVGRNGAPNIDFLTVNAHMLYGNSEAERRREFLALIDWLVKRAQARDRVFYRNFVLMGDLNMDFQDPAHPRNVVDDELRALNGGPLSAARAARVNFPFLTPHPATGAMTTNSRDTQTYARPRLPGRRRARHHRAHPPGPPARAPGRPRQR